MAILAINFTTDIGRDLLSRQRRNAFLQGPFMADSGRLAVLNVSCLGPM